MGVIICRTRLIPIVLLLLLRVRCSFQELCAHKVNSEAPLPPDQAVLSVSCLGNGSANVSYYNCQGKIQVDYVCYDINSHSCANTTVFELNDRCSDEAIHPIMDGCNCSFEACVDNRGQVQMLPSSVKSCAANGDLTEPMPVLSSSFTVVESIVTKSVLALTSDVSRTTLAETSSPISSSPSPSVTYVDEPSNVLEWVIASLAVFIVLLAIVVVIIVTAFALRSSTDKREDGSEWLRANKQMALIGRDPSIESVRTILDLLSLPNMAQVGATQSVGVDVHDEYDTQNFIPPEPAFKLVTDLHFSDDDSATYIHLGVPVPLSPTTADGLTNDLILQETHFPCQSEQPLSDCTISITSSLDDSPPSPSGYESAHERRDSVLSDGYTTVSAMTTSPPTAGCLGNSSTGMVQVHRILDLRPTVLREPSRTDTRGPVASANDITAAVLTGDREKAAKNAETHSSSPSPSPTNVQERTSDATFSRA